VEEGPVKEARRNDEWAYGVVRAAQDQRTACGGGDKHGEVGSEAAAAAAEGGGGEGGGSGGAEGAAAAAAEGGGDEGAGSGGAEGAAAAAAAAASGGVGGVGGGCDLARRVRAFESLSLVESNGRTRAGGRAPQSKYMLVEATEVGLCTLESS
jgi:hypothetical protein